jgi:chromosome segregation ATPase
LITGCGGSDKEVVELKQGIQKLEQRIENLETQISKANEELTTLELAYSYISEKITAGTPQDCHIHRYTERGAGNPFMTYTYKDTACF